VWPEVEVVMDAIPPLRGAFDLGKIRAPWEDHALIAKGNLADGWEFIGPFDDFDEASEYADKHFPNDMTWIATLKNP
jgi:hypothetical protein